MIRLKGITAMGLVLVLAAVPLACSSSTEGDPGAQPGSPSSVRRDGSDRLQRATPAGTYAVGRAERTYVDTSRGTPAHGGLPASPNRTLKTLILYPAEGTPAGPTPTPVANATAAPGPWPMIVFGHGSTRNAADYIDTLSWWASAGYVVVGPNFPLSTTGTPGGTAYGDYPQQTADESFILDAVFADTEDPLDLANLVDHDRVGLGGQSFGAITALGTVASRCCADARFKVATEFAGVWLPYPSKDELVASDRRVPVLFVHGDKDPTVAYQGGRDFWERLHAPGGFLTLVGTGHDEGYFKGGTEPLDMLVANATLAFYDSVLKDDHTGMQRIEELVAAAGPAVARFEPTPARSSSDTSATS